MRAPIDKVKILNRLQNLGDGHPRRAANANTNTRTVIPNYVEKGVPKVLQTKHFQVGTKLKFST